ncbi:hypothetical protein CY34DRAFT_803819 [Suillus luteus UH-Slu-Lm8-n1]|uniref:Uncharacterized protein n=1 Tax=Suillus luteus UH-Slu-Lm8-n1 TaxID=930992 RepID=A0A0D0BB36_9AGAM|nr:hypothetical protein CY34DRAFT_803819 [Suillus luteus UH-Slu-Lm8-n1]
MIASHPSGYLFGPIALSGSWEQWSCIDVEGQPIPIGNGLGICHDSEVAMKVHCGSC